MCLGALQTFAALEENKNKIIQGNVQTVSPKKTILTPSYWKKTFDKKV